MPSTQVLILAAPEDVHYRAVDWALNKIGIKPQILFGNAFPQDETHTLVFGQEDSKYLLKNILGETIDLLDFEVVWNRRGQSPVISPALAEVDQLPARREAEMFIGGARSIAGLRQRWVNAPDREAVANRKPVQLHVARASGLSIPRTIMSNDKDRIRGFFESLGGEAIFKPFHAIQWAKGKEHYVLFANRIAFEELEDPDALGVTAHLFQEAVPKAFELRAIYMGGEILCYRLDTQERAETAMDWRISTDGTLQPTEHMLPDSVQTGMRRYIDHFGLEYGAFDFIVTPRGDHVFLECNVSGQFLFLEEWNHDLPLLSRFIAFLTRDLDLTAAQRSEIETLRYIEFYASAETAAHYRQLGSIYERKFVSPNLHIENAQS